MTSRLLPKTNNVIFLLINNIVDKAVKVNYLQRMKVSIASYVFLSLFLLWLNLRYIF